jgi:electron transfer flavoprotein alpha subunit
MQALEKDESRQGEIIRIQPEASRIETLVRVLESVVVDEDRVNLIEADIVVAGGRGLDNAKGFEMIKELADLLGAGVAASRAAVDSGWIPYQHQVGQTGKTIAPSLYICCGISGAIQHIVGMQSSDTIIAINKDPHAPIFDVATYGIVGDVYDILPKLIELIKAKRGR